MRKIIRTDGTEIDVPVPQTMAQIRAAIGADGLDTVALHHLGHPLHVMLVDDNGYETRAVETGDTITLVPIRARRPLNQKATQLYLANCRPDTEHQIVGDVFICPDRD
jgi:hypothetical protein